METTQEVNKEAVTPEQSAAKGIENTLGVIRVVEGLFNALKLGTYPLHVHEPVMAGMSFLGQFHTQLVNQLPPAVVAELRKAAEQPAAPEASNEPKAQ